MFHKEITNNLSDYIIDDERTHKFFVKSLKFLREDIEMFCENQYIDPPFINKEKRENIDKVDIELGNVKAELSKTKFELEELRKNSKVEYLNPKHPHYPPELHKAVDAWMRLFVDNEFDEDKPIGTIEKIIDWLKKNKPEIIKKKTRKRLATVINPKKFKRGGSPKSGKSKKTTPPV